MSNTKQKNKLRVTKRCSNCYWALRMKGLCSNQHKHREVPFLCEFYDGRCKTDRACEHWKGMKYERPKDTIPVEELDA